MIEEAIKVLMMKFLSKTSWDSIFIIIIKKILLYLLKWDLKFIECLLLGLVFSQGDELEPNEEGLKFYDAVF